ncbi:MAG: hypothetical protein FJ271_00200 [Planctomycetes bacterium]|nr:hypothetical protein [Planctomycetota bacterium]
MSARNRRAVLVTLVWAGCAIAACAEPVLGPCKLRVVLHFAENRVLTPIFQDRVERELRRDLLLAHGDLAEIEVVRRHPRLRELAGKGLQALDIWDELADERDHFVFIDHVDGRYEVHARAHDGATGLCTPVVRRGQTVDRRQVSRLAGQLVERDLGLAGQVMKVGKDEIVIALQGKHDAELARRVQKGDVFAVVRLHRKGTQLHAVRLPWAVLQAIEAPRGGRCRCRLFHRFEQERLTPGPGIEGYRCLQLATVTAPVRLRLIDDKTAQPLDGLQVYVSQRGFGGKGREMTSNAEGLADTKESFARLAFVRVQSGGSIIAQFPVPLVDERILSCRLRASAQTSALEALDFRKELWVQRIYDNLLAGSDRVKEVDRLVGKSLEAALAKAREGAKNLRDQVDSLELERTQLLRQASEMRIGAAQLDLREGEQRLEELRGRGPRIDEFIGRLQDAIKTAGSEETKQLRRLLERARLKEGQTEIDEAITLYEEVVAQDPGQVKVRAHLENLKKAWAPRNPEHVQAREFILKVWPLTEVAKLKADLAEAEKALEICRKNADTLTPRKLPAANLIHAANLRKRLDTLKRRDTEDSRAEARVLAAVAQDLMRFHRALATSSSTTATKKQ